MQERGRLSWSEAFGLSYALLGAGAVMAVAGWGVVSFFWPLIGRVASDFLRGHQADLLLACGIVGLPAATYAFAIDRPNPVLWTACTVVLVLCVLTLAAGAAANCDGPFLFLGGGACR